MEASGAAQGAGARLTVGVDRRMIRRSQGTGAATYAEALRNAIPAAGFCLTEVVDARAAEVTPPGRVSRWARALSPWPVAAKSQAGMLLAPDIYRRAQVHFDVYGRYQSISATRPPQLMHWSYPLPVHLAGVPNLYTVHDLIPLLRPDLTAIAATRSRRMLDRLRQEATHLVTVSDASRQEIIATLGWPADRVTNTYQPVEPPDWSAAQALAARNQAFEQAGVSEHGYFVHVGTIERRKNVGRLIEAYRVSGSTRALVLAGPDGWHAGQELATAQDLLLPRGDAAARPRVIRVGWMPRPVLMGLIQGARALLAPSLAEGFGLPAVEAMALGTPALTSNFGASAEVTGGAAMLVDPLDVRAMAAAIAALDAAGDLHARLSGAGVIRARRFSAEAYAGRLSALYDTVLAGSHRRD